MTFKNEQLLKTQIKVRNGGNNYAFIFDFHFRL